MLEIATNPAKKLARYATIKELPTIFYGASERQLRNYVDLMENDPEYSDGTIKPTKRTTLVNVDQFIEFMKKMESERFK